ncbi:MAG TPA: 2-phosphosulfolactate phosphatase [Tepidisphaeraceae bacterium]|nr:2-phosphosulfolactate phosphatase [Tepidisphaeraceae bacterium]
MRLDVALTPRDVEPGRLRDRAVVVFDVLRATTTMTAALAAGVAGIRVFESLDAAAAAANGFAEPRVLCGERQCLRPPGFDLGNSPGAFDARQHAGRTVFMSTTNGTRAIVAARSAKLLLAGALVNASAVANHLIPAGLDVTLLCAGTDGEPAMEDLLGAGAVIDALAVMRDVELQNDNARVALRMLRCCRGELRPMLADAAGGRNVIAAGLEADIDFAARLDALDVVGRVLGNPLRVVRG